MCAIANACFLLQGKGSHQGEGTYVFCTQLGVVKDLTETGPPLGRLDQGCREGCESESEHWDNKYSVIHTPPCIPGLNDTCIRKTL